MGSKRSRPKENNYMEEIKELDINEKTKTDVLLFNSIKECINRIEVLEEKKSDKLVYKLPAINLCSYSLI